MASLLSASCHVGRYFYYNLADVNDFKRFSSESIAPSADPWILSQAKTDLSLGIHTLYNGRFSDLEALHEKTATLAFLIIKNDSIIHEQYFQGYDSLSIIPSFSIAKSVISALAGIAIDEGFIADIEAPITDYLPSGFHSSLERVKVIDLLNMQAGLRFREGYTTPFSLMAKYYYGRHLDRYVRNLKVVRPPGSLFEYQSAATQVLGMAIEHSTGMSIMQFLEERIWKPAGMEQQASWNTDKPGGRAKFFCCLNATALDFARFGLLYVHDGKRGSIPIIPAQWIADTQKAPEGSNDSQGYPYSYQWRVMPDGGMFAKGILGQYVFVHPEKNVVIVRMGKKSAGLDWGVLFSHICSQL